jgi:hypothetical protein
MRTINTVLILLILSIPAFSQEGEGREERGDISTLFGRSSVSNGGYGSFGAGYSLIDDRDAIVMSGRAAWIVNHTIALGFAGSAFLNDFRYDPVYDEDVNLNGGYGGLLVEPILFPRAPVHLSFPIIGAVGGVAYTRTSRSFNSWDYHSSWVEDTETFFLVEPGVEIEMNIVRFFRLALGVSYRFTTDLQLLDTSPDALEGFTAGVTFKFGKF